MQAIDPIAAQADVVDRELEAYLICKALELDLDRPPGGSHYGVSAPGWRHHVTVPFARPIKPVYIRRLVRFIDAVLAAREDG